MSYTLEGRIEEIGEVQRWDSGFYKQQIIVRTSGEFSQAMPIDFKKEKAELLKDLQVNDNVRVNFDIRTQKTDRRYFVELSGWKIQKLI